MRSESPHSPQKARSLFPVSLSKSAQVRVGYLSIINNTTEFTSQKLHLQSTFNMQVNLHALVSQYLCEEGQIGMIVDLSKLCILKLEN